VTALRTGNLDSFFLKHSQTGLTPVTPSERD
jgi:hypothetical protein